jgi:DNA-binding transcriptional MerR regulator
VLHIRVMENVLTLMEPSVVGHVLGLSPSGIRKMADEGRLRLAARTTRGLRLFDPRDVARLKRKRQNRGPR